MTKTPEEIMAAAVTTARESCGLSRSELGRELAAAGLPPSAAWRFDHLGRINSDELATLISVMTKRREDLARKAAAARSALDALAKITPTLTATKPEPEPPTEPTPSRSRGQRRRQPPARRPSPLRRVGRPNPAIAAVGFDDASPSPSILR